MRGCICRDLLSESARLSPHGYTSCGAPFAASQVRAAWLSVLQSCPHGVRQAPQLRACRHVSAWCMVGLIFQSNLHVCSFACHQQRLPSNLSLPLLPPRLDLGRILSCVFLAAVSLSAAAGFLLYGGRLFCMLRRFPIESRGRRKKLREVGCVTSICATCFTFR